MRLLGKPSQQMIWGVLGVNSLSSDHDAGTQPCLPPLPRSSRNMPRDSASEIFFIRKSEFLEE